MKCVAERQPLTRNRFRPDSKWGHSPSRRPLGSTINVAGRKVSPAKVEVAILATGLARRVTVFGIPSSDPQQNAEISANVELTPGTPLDALKQAATGVLQNWGIPRHCRTE